MDVNKKTPNPIDEYIKSFPEDVQKILEKMRQTIRSVVPEGVERISYQIPSFNWNGKYLIYFAAWKHHVSLYPIPSGNDSFKKEILPYVGGKGTLKFPLDKPIPYDLVKKVVKFRMKEI